MVCASTPAIISIPNISAPSSVALLGAFLRFCQILQICGKSIVIGAEILYTIWVLFPSPYIGRLLIDLSQKGERL